MEEYYTYLETQRSSASLDPLDEEDVFSRLEQKEKDLILAAELGKALLEKNEELIKQSDRVVEEYSQQLEILTQEKHEIKLQLKKKEDEYESAIKELERDVGQLHEEVQKRDQHIHSIDKEKTLIIQELTQQNERLTDQLKQVMNQEQELQIQVQSLRDQVSLRKSSLHGHVEQLEVLREEINLMSSRKSELERRLSSVSEERDSLVGQLEELSERMEVIERDNREKQQQVQLLQQDMKLLHDENAQLHKQLSFQLDNSIHERSNSLFEELEMSNEGSCTHFNGSTADSICSDMESSFRTMSVSDSNEDDFVFTQSSYKVGHSKNLFSFNSDDIECDDHAVTMATSRKVNNKLNTPLVDEYYKLRNDVTIAFHQLQCLCLELKGHKEDIVLQEHCASQPYVLVGGLQIVISELRDLIEKKIEKQMMKQHDERITDIQNLDDLQDQDRDVVVLQAKRERHEAIDKKNEVMDELAKAKLDLFNLNGQLMQAIDQKIQLSQQLEKWQEDMQEVIAANVHKQITNQKGHQRNQQQRKKSESHTANSPLETTKKSRFSFW